MKIKSILSNHKHCINVGNKLKLDYNSFTYPPFYDYQMIECDKNIIVEDIPNENNIFLTEGTRFKHTKYFYFPNEGIYEICLKLNNKIQYFEIQVMNDD